MDPYDTEIQNVPTLSESQTNTERISLKNNGMSHTEGGWPIAIDPTEFEEKMKYCKKVERDESYYASCKGLVETNMTSYLKQNLSLIHISEPTRLLSISYAVFCLKKKKHIT
eukprot:TRINITY_DN57783_c0_g1_i1.p2 TRINITY_DN57783_c0_g1~~TRINITY_DN57783_c0_g1_i1.p2  ORF type:complete len:112 (+),score=35.31 TRINITY_DN57783_c0_g1_i1:212-547(+)